MNEEQIKSYIDEAYSNKLHELNQTLTNISKTLEQISTEKIDTRTYTQALTSYSDLLKQDLQNIKEETLNKVGVIRAKRLIKMIGYRKIFFQEIYKDLEGNIIKYGDLYMKGGIIANQNGVEKGSGTESISTNQWTRVILPREIEFENFWGGMNGYFAQPKRGQTYNNENIDNCLWVWGVNTNGCLGLGTTQNVGIPKKLTLPTRARKIVVGSSGEFGRQSTIILGEDGFIYGSGMNTNGELCLGNNNNVTSFIKSPHLSNIKDVELAHYGLVGYCLAINESGELLGWGSNRYGALGMGNNTNYFSTPQKPILSKKVIAISPSIEVENNIIYQVSMVILEDGSLLGAGYCGEFQLSRNNTVSSTTFIPIQDFTNPSSPTPLVDVKKVSSSSVYGTVVCLKNNGDFYAWGYGNNGFGDNHDIAKQNQNAKVRLRGVKDFKIANNRKTTRCILEMEDGSFKAFGANEDGGLGVGLSVDAYGFNEVRVPEGRVSGYEILDYIHDGHLCMIINDDRLFASGTPKDNSIYATTSTLAPQVF